MLGWLGVERVVPNALLRSFRHLAQTESFNALGATRSTF